MFFAWRFFWQGQGFKCQVWILPWCLSFWCSFMIGLVSGYRSSKTHKKYPNHQQKRTLKCVSWTLWSSNHMNWQASFSASLMLWSMSYWWRFVALIFFSRPMSNRSENHRKMIAKHRRNRSLPLQPRQAEKRKDQEVPPICAHPYLIV